MKLSRLLLEIYQELNADDTGFLTSEAANLLSARASASGHRRTACGQMRNQNNLGCSNDYLA